MPSTEKLKQSVSRTDHTNTETLLKEISNGSREALALLYDQCHVSVYGFALSIVRDRADAEDVLQDVFVKVWQSAGSYKSMGKPMAWILTITRNYANSVLRNRGREDELPPELAQESGTEASENKIVLNAALEVLSDSERQIVMLHAVSGMKHHEIAAVMALPLSTVLSKYNRAKKKLQNAITGGVEQ